MTSKTCRLIRCQTNGLNWNKTACSDERGRAYAQGKPDRIDAQGKQGKIDEQGKQGKIDETADHAASA